MPSQTDRLYDSRALRALGAAITVAIVIVTVVLGLHVLRIYFLYPQTDDAYVRANIVGIART